MKHVLRKTIAVVLSMSLVLSCAGIALADTGSVQPKAEAQSLEKAAAPAVAAEKTLAAAQLLSSGAATPQTAAGNFKLVKRKTGNEKVQKSHQTCVAYDQNEIKRVSSTQNIVGHSTKVNIPAKGTIALSVAVLRVWGDVKAKNIYFGLYKDAKMTKPVESEGYCVAGTSTEKVERQENRVIQVPTGGTYYLGAYSTNSISYPEEFANAVLARAYYVNGADRTVTLGQWNAVGQVKPQANYFRFKAKSTGYIKVTTRGGSTLDTVSLKNATKKKLLGSAAKMHHAVFGVKAGRTYQIRITPKFQKREGLYQIKVTNYKVTEKSGSTRKKAVTISRGSKYAKKGTIIAGSSTSDWYKIKVTAKKAFRVVMKGKTNNKMKMSLYSSKGKLIKSITMNGASHSSVAIRLTNYPKGTYYVKISRGTSQSSGHYSVFWNWNSTFK